LALATLAFAAASLGGCSARDSSPVTASAPAPDGSTPGPATTPAQVSATIAGNAAPDPRAHPVEFVAESFDELYPIFLVRRSMPQGEKSRLWMTRYLGRYVRWTGIVRSFTASGVTLKHLPSTVTFDVSLWMEADQLVRLRKKYKKGDRLTYVGRLDSYDDIFRTLYLAHGLVVETAAPDGGAP
jgi:hypothetical protein